jgi:hypothetical protein
MPKRRQSLRRPTLLAGVTAIVAGSSRAIGQPANGLLIGSLSSRSEADSGYVLAAFRKGLSEGVPVEGAVVQLVVDAARPIGVERSHGLHRQLRWRRYGSTPMASRSRPFCRSPEETSRRRRPSSLASEKPTLSQSVP